MGADDSRRRVAAAIACLALGVVAAKAAVGITVTIDYTYDSSNFFGSGNPEGPIAGSQARASLEAAAAFFSDLLTDSFSEISTPPAFHSANFDGVATWQWNRSFSNPASGGAIATLGPNIAADQYVVFAGARNLSTPAEGGPGGYSWSVDSNGGGFTSTEINQINAITDTFQNQVARRGQPSGFAAWGGAVAFDSAPVVPWHFSHLATPRGNVLSFPTVAIHELAHALGFGASNEWDNLVAGLSFAGANAMAAYGGVVPLADPDHWANNILSPILGSTTQQQTAMAAASANGTSRVFTKLDAAGLADIGWSVQAEVPEPGAGVLVLVGIFVAYNGRHWRSAF